LRDENSNTQADRYEGVFFINSEPELHKSVELGVVEKARSIVILTDESKSDPDATTVMIVLAIARRCEVLGLSKSSRPHIVGECLDARKMNHLKTAGVDEVVCAREYGLGILAQSALHHNLSEVYDRLLHYSDDTNEIYMLEGEQLPQNAGGASFNRIARAVHRYRNAENPVIPIGIRKSDGRIVLNPRGEDGDCIFDENDSMIVIAFTKPNLASIDVSDVVDRKTGK